jgi:hypothetical protein
VCRAERTDEECAEIYTHERMLKYIARAEQRQRDVERARAEHPDAILRIATSVTVSDFEPKERHFGKSALTHYMPDMDPKPDYIGLSQGASGQRDFHFPIAQVKLYLNYPESRMFIDQVYVNEEKSGKQRRLLTPAIQSAVDHDIQVILVWMWRQGWRSYNEDGSPHGNKGMWQWINDPYTPGKTEWGDPTSGLGVILEFNDLRR